MSRRKSAGRSTAIDDRRSTINVRHLLPWVVICALVAITSLAMGQAVSSGLPGDVLDHVEEVRDPFFPTAFGFNALAYIVNVLGLLAFIFLGIRETLRLTGRPRSTIND